MALSTRVWSVGKLLCWPAPSALTYLCASPSPHARRAASPGRRRPATWSDERSPRQARWPRRTEPQGRRDRRVGRPSPAGTIVSRIPQPGVKTRRAAERQGVDQRGSARRPRCRRWSANPSGRRSCALSRTAQLAPSSEIRSADYPADTVVAQDPAARDARAPRVSLLRQPRGAGDNLRDAGSDRRERRSRRRSAAVAGLPRLGRGRPSLSGRARRASSCGRARRADSSSAAGDPISLEVSR